MITIEQKLLLFSKLINQSMEKSFKEELKELEKQYSEKINKSIAEIDAAAKSIEERAKIKTEMKKKESLSKSKVIIKREILILKEKYYYIFMEELKDRLSEFVKSKEYKEYFLSLIKNINTSNENCRLEIYLTESDRKKYSALIKKELNRNKDIDIEFKNSYNIIGGFIVVDKNNNTKIDLSFDSVLEDNKTYIMKTIFDALEAGGINE